MKTNKFLNYFNLVVAIVLLWTYLKSIPLDYDYAFIVGLVLTIWYNWWTLKRIMGQKSTLGKLNYIVGIETILFGALLTIGSIAMISARISEREDAFNQGTTLYSVRTHDNIVQLDDTEVS